LGVKTFSRENREIVKREKGREEEKGAEEQRLKNGKA
jgi:hypothetical protein